VEVQIDGTSIEYESDISTIELSTKLNSVFKVIVNSAYHPKNYLSQNTNTFSMLFKLLASNQSFHQVWELLNKLPTNSEAREIIR